MQKAIFTTNQGRRSKKMSQTQRLKNLLSVSYIYTNQRIYGNDLWISTFFFYPSLLFWMYFYSLLSFQCFNLNPNCTRWLNCGVTTATSCTCTWTATTASGILPSWRRSQVGVSCQDQNSPSDCLLLLFLQAVNRQNTLEYS